jgi:CheY-like chemotaxis protein
MQPLGAHPSLRVLIVDDYPDTAELTSALVAALGYECSIGLSGRAAIDQAALFHPDIVILDIGLPDMTGYEVARTLRARTDTQSLYLAAVTGWGDHAAREQAIAAGFDYHALKPITRTALEDILRRGAERVVARGV